MQKHSPFKFGLILPLFAALLLADDCRGQIATVPDSKSAADWKAFQLVEIDDQLSDHSDSGVSRDELNAQKFWLQNWTAGEMTAKPLRNLQLPELRSEPVLDSPVAALLRQRLIDQGGDQDETDLLTLTQALASHPNDIGLHQLYLQWLDAPVRRKKHLTQVDDSARHLIKSLKLQSDTNPAVKLATQFAMYRRARALAYRELPDVVLVTPIKDSHQLNEQILTAYQELIAASGKGHSEFILLEIRMLRRGKHFGSALVLLEQYGSVVKLQWYLKKRRDLLKELGWELPHAEAAKIYADQFPEE